jgi:hypothetical protein
LSERENPVPQWAFKLNSGLAAAQSWHLKGHPSCTLKVKKNINSKYLTSMDLRDVIYVH